jgi:hypothetical protein
MMNIEKIRKCLQELQKHPDRTIFEKRIYVQEAINIIDSYEEYRNGEINKFNQIVVNKIKKEGESWVINSVLEHMTNLIKPMAEYFPNLPNRNKDSRIKMTIKFIDHLGKSLTLKDGRIKGVFPNKNEENCFYEFIRVPEVKKALSHLYYDVCEQEMSPGLTLNMIEDNMKPKAKIELFQNSKTSKNQKHALIGIDDPCFDTFFADTLFHLLKETDRTEYISK